MSGAEGRGLGPAALGAWRGDAAVEGRRRVRGGLGVEGTPQQVGREPREERFPAARAYRQRRLRGFLRSSGFLAALSQAEGCLQVSAQIPEGDAVLCS